MGGRSHELLSRNGLHVWLLTSGLALAKHARRAAELFDAITVSLDGTDPKTYAAIRGLDAFDKVCEGIRAAASPACRPSIRVTLQRGNYRQLPAFVDLAKDLGARQVSFLAVDVANPHAFGRSDDFVSDLALRAEDLPVFEQILVTLERDHAEDFRSGFIAESPQKLRRILQYFAALRGRGATPRSAAMRRSFPRSSAQPVEFNPASSSQGRRIRSCRRRSDLSGAPERRAAWPRCERHPRRHARGMQDLRVFHVA